MRVEDLRHLVSVADWKSIRLAAATLGVDASTLSRRIRDLEDAIGVSLFERHSGGVRLTPAGAAFVASARQAIAAVDQALLAASLAGAGGVGVLHLGAWSLGAGPAADLVVRYARLNRDVAIRITEGDPATLYSHLLERRVDAVVCAGADPPSAAEGLTLSQERIVAAVPEAWPLPPTLTWDDLAPLWRLSPGAAADEPLQAQLNAAGGPRLRPLAQACGRENALCLVRAGVGFLPLPERSGGTPPPGVRFAPVTGPALDVAVRLCWLPTSDHPPLRRFVSLARRMVRVPVPPA